MAVVLFEIDAAVEHVDPIVVILRPAGNDEDEATARAGIDASACCGYGNTKLGETFSRQVENGEGCLLPVGNNQSPCSRRVLFFLLVFIPVTAGLLRFDWVNVVTQRNDSMLVHAGVMYELGEPAGFQTQTHAEHQVCVGNSCYVPGAWLVGMRVASGRQKTEHFHFATADIPYPVSYKVSRRDYLQRGSRRWSWRRGRGRRTWRSRRSGR